MSPSWKTSVSMAEKHAEQGRASLHPWFTPLMTGNGWEYLSSSRTLVFMLSWNCQTIAMNLTVYPNLTMNTCPLQRESNVLAISTNVMYSPTSYSRHFSCSCRATNNISTVFRLAQNTHSLSRIRSLCRWALGGLRKMHAKIFPVMESKEMSRWVSGAFLFSLR